MIIMFFPQNTDERNRGEKARLTRVIVMNKSYVALDETCSFVLSMNYSWYYEL